MSILNKTVYDYDDFKFSPTLVVENGISKLSTDSLSLFDTARCTIESFRDKEILDSSKSADQYIIEFIKYYYQHAIKRDDILDDPNPTNMHDRLNPNNVMAYDKYNTETEIDYIDIKAGIVLNDCVNVRKNNHHCSHISRLQYHGYSTGAILIFYYQVDLLALFNINYVKLRIPVYTISKLNINKTTIFLPYLIKIGGMTTTMTVKDKIPCFKGQTHYISVYGLKYTPSEYHRKKLSIDDINLQPQLNPHPHPHPEAEMIAKIDNNFNPADMDIADCSCDRNEMMIFNLTLFNDPTAVTNRYSRKNIAIPLSINKNINEDVNETRDFHFYCLVRGDYLQSVKFDCLNVKNEIVEVKLYSVDGTFISNQYPDDTGLILYNKVINKTNPRRNHWWITVKYTDTCINQYNQIIDKFGGHCFRWHITSTILIHY